MKTLLILSLLLLSCGQNQDHAHKETQLYTCSMHPNIISEEAGSCPQCGMDLTPIKQSTASSSEKENKIMYYRAPMDPNEIYDNPGKSKMGMDLVPVYQNEVEGVSVRISPALEQNIGVRTAQVLLKNFIHKITAVGSIAYDETRINTFSSKFSGWVEKLYINKVGQTVRKGDPLYQIYSPDVVSAQEEYVSAIKMSKLLGESGDELIMSAKKRLEYWDITEKQIDDLKESLEVQRTVTIHSPYKGYLTQRMISNGDYLQKGKQAFQITDFSKVWVIAEFFDKDSHLIALHDKVTVTVKGMNKTINGSIDYIYPEIDAKTRTIKARIVLPNPNNSIKINMFAKVEIIKEEMNPSLQIPSEAVIKTGERTLVILKNKDMFTPRNVSLGKYSNGFYEILNGLNENDIVVTSAQFLIDSESKLNEAIQKILDSKNTDMFNQMKSE